MSLTRPVVHSPSEFKITHLAGPTSLYRRSTLTDLERHLSSELLVVPGLMLDPNYKTNCPSRSTGDFIVVEELVKKEDF